MYPNSFNTAAAYDAAVRNNNINYIPSQYQPSSTPSTSSTPTNDPAGSFWKGQDGNVYVYGSDGTNNAGAWDDNTIGYWDGRGYVQIADPYTSTGILGDSTTTSNYTGGGLGSGGGSPSYSAIDMALIDAQINSANQGLGRIGNQRSIGEGNIDKTFNNAQADRQSQFNSARGQYDTTKERNTQDYSNIRSGVRRDAGQQYTALQRLLGGAGAGRSSAAQILTPFAVGREASQRFGQTQDQFGRNMSDLDTSWQSTVSSDQRAKKQLDDERTNRRNELYSGLDSSAAGINDQLLNLNLQKQRLQGGGLGDVQAAISPYQTRISELLNQVDNYGKLAVTARPEVSYNRPDLQQYNYSRFATPTLGGERQPTDDYTSPFVQLLREEEEKKQAQPTF